MCPGSRHSDLAQGWLLFRQLYEASAPDVLASCQEALLLISPSLQFQGFDRGRPGEKLSLPHRVDGVLDRASGGNGFQGNVQ